MIALSRGQPYPLPLPPGDGMVAVLRAAGDALDLSLVVALAGMQAGEARALRRDPARLALVASPQALMIGLRVGRLEMDAPHALAREAAADRVAIRRLARAWAVSPPPRWLIEVHAVDRASRIVAGLRAVTVSRDWAGLFAAALLTHGDDPSLADNEIDTLYRRLPDHRALVAAAAIVETGGRA